MIQQLIESGATIGLSPERIEELKAGSDLTADDKIAILDADPRISPAFVLKGIGPVMVGDYDKPRKGKKIDINEVVRSQMKTLRINHRMTMVEFAVPFGLTTSSISEKERGRQNWSVAQIYTACRAFKVSYSWILEREEKDLSHVQAQLEKCLKEKAVLLSALDKISGQ